MKKLTRKQLRNVTGGLQDPPPGYFCFTADTGSGPGLPGGGLDPDCNLGSDPKLYCSPGDLLGCR